MTYFEFYIHGIAQVLIGMWLWTYVPKIYRYQQQGHLDGVFKTVRYHLWNISQARKQDKEAMRAKILPASATTDAEVSPTQEEKKKDLSILDEEEEDPLPVGYSGPFRENNVKYFP